MTSATRTLPSPSRAAAFRVVRLLPSLLCIATIGLAYDGASHGAAAASACPANAHVARVEVTGDVRVTHCACNDGYRNIAGACRADDPAARAVVDGLNAIAARIGWDAEKRARLSANLNALLVYLHPTPDAAAAWARILARGQDPELQREAARAHGPELFAAGAGLQTTSNDCVVFALANAAALPYGVVATRADELIRDATWRPSAERADPERVFAARGGGLNGGEALFLAEAFGQADVVPFSDFARTLQNGRPLMVAVDKNGDHEVVLSKAFQHGGTTWYEMIDSAQGPLRRLYVSTTELQAIRRADIAIAYRPAPGRTPSLLH